MLQSSISAPRGALSGLTRSIFRTLVYGLRRPTGGGGRGFVCARVCGIVCVLVCRTCVPAWGAGMHWGTCCIAAPCVDSWCPHSASFTRHAGMVTAPPSGTAVPPRCPSTCWQPLMPPCPAWATPRSSSASSCWPSGPAAASPPAACPACRGRCSAASAAGLPALCRQKP